ncbi:MAG: DUF1643 domain-containing protein [Leptolyngbya sp. RL_3_1]|nr:DUF1643 domain-containing protein [Leptolyngbya sp. RL_3_1]
MFRIDRPLERSATFDVTGQYRYCLGRRWDSRQPCLTWVMLNPSQADHRQEDPTLRRCLGLTQAWGYGALTVVNLFAYCSSQPRDLKRVADPIGPENDRYLLAACADVPTIVLAWGNGGNLHGRDRAVLALLARDRDRCHCLGRNQTGQPRHPLYVKRQAQLCPWPGETMA